MAFANDMKYFSRAIENIRKGILGTEKDLAILELSDDKRAIAAHKAQIATYKKNLALKIEARKHFIRGGMRG